MGNINFNEEFKDKTFKIVVAIALAVVLLILIAFTAITILKIRAGEHVKIFGLEYNIPKDHPDTIYKSIALNAESAAKTLFKPENPKLESHAKKTYQHLLKNNDTDKKITIPTLAKNVNAGDNSGNVGDNGHVVNGINYGINGDVNINRERQLTNQDKIRLLDFIESLKKKKGVNPTCFTMALTNNSNGTKLAGQIEEFLKQQGYTTSGYYNTEFLVKPLAGVSIKIDSKGCFYIIVGGV